MRRGKSAQQDEKRHAARKYFTSRWYDATVRVLTSVRVNRASQEREAWETATLAENFMGGGTSAGCPRTEKYKETESVCPEQLERVAKLEERLLVKALQGFQGRRRTDGEAIRNRDWQGGRSRDQEKTRFTYKGKGGSLEKTSETAGKKTVHPLDDRCECVRGGGSRSLFGETEMGSRKRRGYEERDGPKKRYRVTQENGDSHPRGHQGGKKRVRRRVKRGGKGERTEKSGKARR